MNKRLIKILVCPVCKGELEYFKRDEEMICQRDGLAYPVRKDVPILLEVDARRFEVVETSNQK